MIGGGAQAREVRAPPWHGWLEEQPGRAARGAEAQHPLPAHGRPMGRGGALPGGGAQSLQARGLLGPTQLCKLFEWTGAGSLSEG